MKQKFSSSWESSKQPRKQVKFRANAPNHIKRKFMAATLDKDLRKKHGRRSVEVRKGDEVKVMRGKYSKKQGKVSIVDVKHTRIQIDGLQRAKNGGEKLVTWFHPSKVKIISLDDSDSRRFKKKGEAGKVGENKEIKKAEKKVNIKKDTKHIKKGDSAQSTSKKAGAKK